MRFDAFLGSPLCLESSRLVNLFRSFTGVSQDSYAVFCDLKKSAGDRHVQVLPFPVQNQLARLKHGHQ
jgi:hypothetical protein